MCRLLSYVEDGDTKELLWTSVHSNLAKLKESSETRDGDCEAEIRRVLQMVLTLDNSGQSKITCELCTKFLISQDL